MSFGKCGTVRMNRATAMRTRLSMYSNRVKEFSSLSLPYALVLSSL